MSRSFKSNPILKYGGMGRYGKRQSNKRVRKFRYMRNGRFYRRIYSRYNIRDIVITYWDYEDYIKYLRK